MKEIRVFIDSQGSFRNCVTFNCDENNKLEFVSDYNKEYPMIKKTFFNKLRDLAIEKLNTIPNLYESETSMYFYDVNKQLCFQPIRMVKLYKPSKTKYTVDIETFYKHRYNGDYSKFYGTVEENSFPSNEFNVGDVVYDSSHGAIGVVLSTYDRGEVRLDSDGVQCVDDLEPVRLEHLSNSNIRGAELIRKYVGFRDMQFQNREDFENIYGELDEPVDKYMKDAILKNIKNYEKRIWSYSSKQNILVSGYSNSKSVDKILISKSNRCMEKVTVFNYR